MELKNILNGETISFQELIDGLKYILEKIFAFIAKEEGYDAPAAN